MEVKTHVYRKSWKLGDYAYLSYNGKGTWQEKANKNLRRAHNSHLMERRKIQFCKELNI